jgi:hypothetical protein
MPQTKPKQALTLTFPAALGVNRPLLPMVPAGLLEESDQVIGGACTIERWS